jgi:phage terminase small subunit
MALTAKKKLFAEAVLGGKSNKDAAIAAGYSAATASAAGSRLVKDPAVVTYLEERRKAVAPSELPVANSPPFDLNKILQYSDPKAYLLAAMNDGGLENKLRVDAAKALMPFVHSRKGEGGKKEERDEAAKRAANKFAPTAAPKLVVNNRK